MRKRMKLIIVSVLMSSISFSVLADPMVDSTPPNTSLINSDVNVTAAMPTPAVSSGLQTTLINQQRTLIAQIQKMQQDLSALQGVVQNQDRALQQMQINLLTLQQALQQKGISVNLNLAGSPSMTPPTAQSNPAPLKPAQPNLLAPRTSVAPIPAQQALFYSSPKPSQAMALPAASNAPKPVVSVQAAQAVTSPSVNNTTAAVTSISPPAPSASVSPNEAKLYQLAYGQLQSKDYSTAIVTFQNYLKTYPQGQQADSVHYWLGQLYGISGNDQAAVSELTTVVQSYPKSPKAADAMFQLGMMAYSNADYATASKWFTELVANFPNSPSAGVAKQQLQQLQKAGY